MSTQQPLAAFSYYLSGRHQALLTIADEIVAALDACIDDQAPARTRASNLMWLWTLGAYEVTRTMSQAQTCFSPSFLRSVTDLKLALERVRVPNTKMERIKYDRRAKATPVSSDREPDLWDPLIKNDLQVGDPADPASARGLLRNYAHIMASLTPADVLMRHEDSFMDR